MASNLGTVFVELSLDDKVYKQKLGETLTSTQATAKGIETSWKALGSKSEALFNQQRQAAENAYTLIKNSAKSTANDIIRAEEAKNQKIKSLNEQQFGHQTSMLATLKANWLATTAAIYGSIQLIGKAWDLAKIGAEYAEQSGILDNLASKYSMTADQIVEKMQYASDEMIAKSDLMQVALRGIAKGLTPDQLINLADASKMLADIAGGTATDALNQMTTALEAARIKGVKALAGANIDLEKTFGKLTTVMSDADKAFAMYLLLMQFTIDKQKEQKKQVSGVADEMEKLEAKYKDATLTAGTYWMSVVVWAAAALKAVKDYVVVGGNLLGNEFSPNAPKKRGETGPYTYEVPPLGTQTPEQKETDIEKQMKAFRERLEKLLNGKGTGKSEVAARLKEEERLLDAKYKHELTIAKATYDAEEQMRKDAEDGAKTSAIGITRLTKERGDAARELYKDMKGYEQEFYDESVKLIYDQVAKFREAGLDEIAIDKWIKEQKRKAQLQSDRTKPEGSFSEGWNQGIDDWSNEVGNSFKQAEKMAKDTATAMSGSFSDLFFDAFTGEMKSFEDYWKGFTNAVLRSFSDMLAQMLTKWIMNFELMKAIEVAGQAASDVWGAIIKVVGSVAAVAHEGGVVGETSFPSRMMPAYAFADAPRLHNGFMPDEFPAILQRGEAVIPKNQVASSNSRQEEKAQPQVNNIVINAVDAKSFADMCNRNPNAIISPILAGMKNNKIRSDMKGLLK